MTIIIYNNDVVKKLNIKHASGLIDSTLGMLLPRNSKGIVLKTRFGIHTFFMKEPIDVLILDNQNKIVRMKISIKPNIYSRLSQRSKKMMS